MSYPIIAPAPIRPAEAPPDPDRHSAPVARRTSLITRRRLEVALGAIWLLDGLLQLQPYMFGKTFFANVLGMASMGAPTWLAELPHRLLVLLSPAHVWFDALFALIQVAIGIGLLWRRCARVALIASFAWGLGVWVVGEGLGGMFMPGMSMFGGAPGAVALYVILSVILWPTDRPSGRSVAASSPLGERGVLGLWVVIWAGTALLELQRANSAQGALAATLRYQAHDEPGFVAGIDRGIAHLLGMHGTEIVLVFALVQVLIGFEVIPSRRRRPFLAASIGVSTLYWIVGQNFGGILTGTGTDPGLGPLMLLLALTLWPARERGHPSAVSRAASSSRMDLLPRQIRPSDGASPRATAVALGAESEAAEGTHRLRAGTGTMADRRRSKRTRSIVGSTVVALALVATLAWATSPARSTSVLGTGTTAVTGTPAPVFRLPSLDDPTRALSLTQFRGRLVAVNFWASWCPPCRHEMPALQAASAVLGPRVVLLGVDTNDTRANALQFARHVRARYGLAFDPTGQLATTYGVYGLPTTIFVSPDGKEVARHLG
ncbi:MAG: TlpA family protein disulfide reductase, partial [Acidimicrobiales bacterium]